MLLSKVMRAGMVPHGAELNPGEELLVPTAARSRTGVQTSLDRHARQRQARGRLGKLGTVFPGSQFACSWFLSKTPCASESLMRR